ncbi:Acetoacetyl-CoA synthase [Caenispirillum salinarum AK4]|uniref:Acetoacetyl-CoA synthase n=1 Tax=Caenispirillum salinarum AK4 TaxID=1238182 RepID=K9H5X9_9PROT|nr:type II toxin-antitoxin system CcdA family antitoxin [Caenispirillum salinarum]EKV32504.1 Acetoacetyl-CoA synthase [Caenispirillum salinarum AK4]
MEDRQMSPKREARVMISEDILLEAEKLGVDLSEAVEETLVAALREKRAAQWRAENRESIDSYNAHIERNGCFGDEFRTF